MFTRFSAVRKGPATSAVHMEWLTVRTAASHQPVHVARHHYTLIDLCIVTKAAKQHLASLGTVVFIRLAWNIVYRSKEGTWKIWFEV